MFEQGYSRPTHNALRLSASVLFYPPICNSALLPNAWLGLHAKLRDCLDAQMSNSLIQLGLPCGLGDAASKTPYICICYVLLITEITQIWVLV